MLKRILVLCLILSSTSYVNAHCGSCGVGDKKDTGKSHSKVERKASIKDLNLSKTQAEKHDELTQKYQKEIDKLKEKYNADVLAILTKEQQDKYAKKGLSNSLSCSLK